MSEIPNFQPFSVDELVEKRRYVASRAARDHWGAAELDHVDNMARWLATLDEAVKDAYNDGYDACQDQA